MAEKSIKEKLADMSDMELYNLLNAVCVAAGVDKVRARALTADIPRLRRMISSLSDGQIANLMASLGGDTGDMMKRLGGG